MIRYSRGFRRGGRRSGGFFKRVVGVINKRQPNNTFQQIWPATSLACNFGSNSTAVAEYDLDSPSSLATLFSTILPTGSGNEFILKKAIHTFWFTNSGFFPAVVEFMWLTCTEDIVLADYASITALMGTNAGSLTSIPYASCSAGYLFQRYLHVDKMKRCIMKPAQVKEVRLTRKLPTNHKIVQQVDGDTRYLLRQGNKALWMRAYGTPSYSNATTSQSTAGNEVLISGIYRQYWQYTFNGDNSHTTAVQQNMTIGTNGNTQFIPGPIVNAMVPVSSFVRTGTANSLPQIHNIP